MTWNLEFELTLHIDTHKHTQNLSIVHWNEQQKEIVSIFTHFNGDALVEVVIGADRRKVNKPYINFSSASLIQFAVFLTKH